MINSIQGSGMMQPMGPPPGAGQQLTSEQIAVVKDILSEYDPDDLTQEDADAIHQAFKDAGIQPMMGLKEAIEAAGFDAEALREMGGQGQKGPGGPPPGGPQGMNMDGDSLQTLYDILGQFDLENMSEEDSASLYQMLTENGLLSGGGMLDIYA